MVYLNLCSNYIFLENYIPLNYRASYGYNTQYDLKDGITSKKVLIEIVHSTQTEEIMKNIKLLDYPTKNIKIVYYLNLVKILGTNVKLLLFC